MKKSKSRISETGLLTPRWAECSPNPCEFDLVAIGDEYADPAGLLLEGMEVMLPCRSCGTSPNEYMTWYDAALQEAENGLSANLAHKNTPLYHWSPSVRRNQIIRFGLRPGMRPTTHSEWRAPYTCFATDPAWAWALSGGMGWSPDGEWDLWETWWNELTEPEVLGTDDGDGTHEVRTHHRVYKRSLKYLGTRTKL